MPGRSSPYPTPVVLLTLRAVIRMTSIPRSTIYALKAAGQFPEPVRVGARGVRWIADEVTAWIATRPRAGSDLPVR